MEINQDYILAAAYLFEQNRGIQHRDEEKSLIVRVGIRKSDEKTIAKKLYEFVETNAAQGDSLVGSAVWALGKRCDTTYRSLFERVMAGSIDSDSNALFQSMLALENLDIKLFDGSASLMEVQRNREIALNYLSQNT